MSIKNKNIYFWYENKLNYYINIRCRQVSRLLKIGVETGNIDCIR